MLKIASQPYYRWLANPVMVEEVDEAYLAYAYFDAHRDDPEFGYRYLVDEAANAGQTMSARTAQRICSDNGWQSAASKKRGKNGKEPRPPVHDDRCVDLNKHGAIRHVLDAHGANELRIGDITDQQNDEIKFYPCVNKNVYSNRITAYSIDARMKSRLTVVTLSNAVVR